MLLDALFAHLRPEPQEERTVASVAREFARREKKRAGRQWAARLIRGHPWAVGTCGLVLVAVVASSWTLILLALAIGIAVVMRTRKRGASAVFRTEQRRNAIGGELNYTLANAIWRGWPQLALEIGLARRRVNVDGVGVAQAVGAATDPYRTLHTEAYGTWDEYEVPRIVSLSRDPLGVRVSIELLRGQSIETYSRALGPLGSAWRVASVRVQAGNPGLVDLIAVNRDPLREVVEVSQERLPKASPQGVVVGRDESGRPLFFPLDQTSTVAGGLPGFGKSVLLNVVAAGVAACNDVMLIALDMKAGIEFADWEPRLSAFGIDQLSGLEILERLDELGQLRLASLRGSGSKSMSRRGYSPEEPLILVVIDEVTELFDPSEDRKRSDRLRTLVSRGVRLYRAAGISYVLATQKPSADCIPTLLRDCCGNRVAVRCSTREQEVTILGPSFDDPGTPTATAIGPNQRGVVVASDDAGNRVYGRVDFIDESTCQAVAESTAHLRISLNDMVARAKADCAPEGTSTS